MFHVDDAASIFLLAADTSGFPRQRILQLRDSRARIFVRRQSAEKLARSRSVSLPSDHQSG
jgi:hypothetical protein